MKRFSIPYPDAYSPSSTRYAYTDPTTGVRYEYIAGQDGIDENWIEIIKEEDRMMNAADKRAQRWRKKSDETGYARTVISLEGLTMDHIENSETLRDPHPDIEQMIIAKHEAQEFAQAYAQALASLSKDMQVVWTLHTEHDLPIRLIADQLNIPYETVKKRIQRAKIYLQKKLRNYCPQNAPN